MASLSDRTGVIPEIQVLRGIAVIATVFSHSFTNFPAGYQNPGWLGVMLFFVISGFVVCRSMETGRWQPGPFLIKRVFRLFPALTIYISAAAVALYWLSGVPGWPFGAVGTHDIIIQSAIGVLGLQSITLMAGLNAPINMQHLWSLSVEDIFYLGFAIFVGLAALTARDIRRLIGVSCLIAGVLVTVARSWWGGAWYWGVLGPLDLVGDGIIKAVLHYTMNWRLEFLLFGVSLYCFARPAVARPRGLGWLSWLMLVLPFAVEVFRRGDAMQSAAYYHMLTIPTAVCCFLVLVWLVGSRGVELPMPGRLRHVLVWFGDRSYSIYLFHLLFICLIWVVATHISADLTATPFLFDPLIFIVSLGLTAASVEPLYRFVEAPLTRLGRRIADKGFPRRPVAARI